jgi:hypothetical protein
MFIAVGIALLILLTLVCGGICLVRALPRGRPRVLILLGFLVVLGAGAWLRLWLVPAHHVMYLDEPWYQAAAGSLLDKGSMELCEETYQGEMCEPYPKAPGWPVMLASVFMFTGVSDMAAIRLCTLLGIVSLLLAAACARLAGGGWLHSLSAAAMLAVFPSHVSWSATAETSVPATAALLAGLCGVLLFLKKNRIEAALLAMGGLTLCATIRPELLVAMVPAGVQMVLMKKRMGYIAAGLLGIGLLFAVLSMFSMWELNEEIYGGAFFSLGNIFKSPAALFEVPGFGMAFLLVFLLGTAGAAALFFRERSLPAVLLFGSAFLCIITLFAFERFAERMIIAPVAVLIPLAGFAGDWWKWRVPWIAGVLVVGLSIPGLNTASRPSDTQILETWLSQAVAKHSLEEDALIIAEYPAVLTTGHKVMATDRALAGDLAGLIGKRPVYFLRDMYCEEGFQGADKPIACGRILKEFELSPEVEVRAPGRVYGLYRLLGR